MRKKFSQSEKPYATFVRRYMEGYNAGESAKEIAKRLDTSEASLLVYASNLRREGVRLPKFNDRLDVNYLNSLIRKAVR